MNRRLLLANAIPDSTFLRLANATRTGYKGACFPGCIQNRPPAAALHFYRSRSDSAEQHRKAVAKVQENTEFYIFAGFRIFIKRCMKFMLVLYL